MIDDNFYKLVIEHSPVGYVHHRVIYDNHNIPKNYEFIEINQAFGQMIGIEKEYLTGKKISDIYSIIKRGRFSWAEFYTNLAANWKKKEFEHYFGFLDKHFRVNTYYPKEDQLVMYFTDISNEIRETEKLNLLSDNIDTQVWYLQDPLTYGSANKAHADFVGIDKKDLEFKNVCEFLSHEEAEICIRDNQKVFNEKKQVNTEEWLINSKGEKRLIKISKNPKFNAKGHVEFVICSGEDITEESIFKEENKVKEKILYSMIDFTQELMTNKNHYDALANGISMLGEATGVDRVYYWENHYDKTIGKYVTSQRFEWCVDGVTEQIQNPELQNIPFDEVGDFIEVLAANDLFIADVKDLRHEDGNTKKILESQEILSIVVLPVFIGEEFRGFIGFDSCRCEKKWPKVEISLLNSFILLYTKAVERDTLKEDYKG